MALNAGNSNDGKLRHGTIFVDFENKTAKIDVEALVRKLFGSNITRYTVICV